jgi:hypothetical protein
VKIDVTNVPFFLWRIDKSAPTGKAKEAKSFYLSSLSYIGETQPLLSSLLQ